MTFFQFIFSYLKSSHLQRKGTKLKALEREIQILKMVCHPHIIYLHKIYESNEKIYLVLELCIGELTKLMNEKKVLMENEARKMVRDIISAVAYLHKNGRYVLKCL